MKMLRLGIVTFIVYLIQTTFIQYFAVGGITPNLMVVLVICFALTQTDYKRPMFYGLACGILLDFSSETIFGVHALLCMFGALLCEQVSTRFFKGKFFVSLLFVCVISFLYEVAYFALSFMRYDGLSVTYALLGVALPTMVYNAVVSVVVLLIMRRGAAIGD
ncbi:MAG TPA: rod shape-determining protein MreD [Candidatus Aphodoplasma excrementigallinarum]|uniref:Rod shape-determining protein MreD n=1 Tax=Candidatus Aphodoplasma excrementigallinarum TaxID=2840673 RepID=A0A9D1T000_9FIRM|nr:rod shape-determining protein MreD [Candidatus Aphodoplasma excrementigallinarum]